MTLSTILPTIQQSDQFLDLCTHVFRLNSIYLCVQDFGLKGLIHLTDLYLYVQTLQFTTSQEYSTRAMIFTKCGIDMHKVQIWGNLAVCFESTSLYRLTDCHCVKYTKQAVVVGPYLIYEMSVLLNFVIITVQIYIARVISLFCTGVISKYISPFNNKIICF